MTVVNFSAEAKGKKSPCASVTTTRTKTVDANYVTNKEADYPYAKHHIYVWTDDMHNPYEGKPSRQNDGVKTNEQRNMNVTMASTGGDLPANDGSR